MSGNPVAAATAVPGGAAEIGVTGGCMKPVPTLPPAPDPTIGNNGGIGDGGNESIGGTTGAGCPGAIGTGVIGAGIGVGAGSGATVLTVGALVI